MAMAVHVCVCVCVCGVCLAESQVGPFFPRPWHPRDLKSRPVEWKGTEHHDSLVIQAVVPKIGMSYLVGRTSLTQLSGLASGMEMIRIKIDFN